MPKLTNFLKPKRGDETPRRNETDTDFLARMVRENANRDNFSALTFRFCHRLNLDLDTAYLARTIAANAGGYDSLNRYSELELSAASVYMASYLQGVPKPLAQIAPLTRISADTIHTLSTELFRELERLSDAGWRVVFRGSGFRTSVENRRALSFPPLSPWPKSTRLNAGSGR